MMFMPQLMKNHFFVICFNFKGAKIEILDNMSGKLGAMKMARVKMVVSYNYLTKFYFIIEKILTLLKK